MSGLGPCQRAHFANLRQVLQVKESETGTEGSRELLFRDVGVSGRSVRQNSGVEDKWANEVFQRPFGPGADPA